jgi:hypothetical protein
VVGWRGRRPLRAESSGGLERLSVLGVGLERVGEVKASGEAREAVEGSPRSG